MAKYHVIYDVYYMYYRYKFLLDSDKLRKLSTDVPQDFLEIYNKLREMHGMEKSDSTIDVSYVYYPLRGIEVELSKYLNTEDEVAISICFDSKTERHTEGHDYKSNRAGKLSAIDHFNIDFMEMILRMVGYNVCKQPGYEADDLIFSLVHLYKKDFDKTVIFTPDADVLVNIDDNVSVFRYKTFEHKHIEFNKDTFEELMSKEYKCRMPYNSIVLYKCLCGDKSDTISGVKGFGPKSFDKLITRLEEQGEDFTKLLDYERVAQIITENTDIICSKVGSSITQAMEALELVKNYLCENMEKPPILNKETIRANKDSVYVNSLHFKL